MKEETIKILEEKLNASNVATRSQGGMNLSYIESHHAIREANRAFGFDGWDYEIVELSKVSEEKNTNGNNVIGYIARVRVRVGDIIREDVGFGSGISKMLADAHEGATKEAVSDAMKRALRTFGDIFGLALYDKKQEHVEKTSAKTSAKKPEQFSQAPVRNWVKEIELSASMDELQSLYKEAFKATKDEEHGKIIIAKDKRKQQLKKEEG